MKPFLLFLAASQYFPLSSQVLRQLRRLNYRQLQKIYSQHGYSINTVRKDFQSVIKSINSNKPVNILYDADMYTEGYQGHWNVIKSVEQHVKTLDYRMIFMNPSSIGYDTMKDFSNALYMFNVSR